MTTTRTGSERQPVRLLLINPRFPESFWSFRWAVRRVLAGKRTVNPPLGLATLAALCPPHWQVRIVDENVESVPMEPEADLIGVAGMGVQFPRQRELLGYYRARGYPVVAGGSYASLCPERYTGLADSIVAGEAEYIWPRFCADFEAGRAAPLYRETGEVDLADSPVPRFDLLRLDAYAAVSMQFSRGCPFRCEFCDIIVMFGRRPRTKSPEQVGRELDALRAHGVSNVFFVDDNLIGNKKKAKELLAYLADYQRRHDYAFQFGTEVSLNLAEDAELMRLMREAHFGWVFIGIESPDEASLRGTGKTQNTRRDLLESVRIIYRNGIDVLGGFIIGFDQDDLGTFERQRRFIMSAGIQIAMIGLLTALPRTPLYRRLASEGRLLPEGEESDNTSARTNFVPKGMDLEAMTDAYRALYRTLVSDRGIADRIRSKLRDLRQPVYQGDYPLAERARILANFLARGLLPGGPRRWYHFARTLEVARPRTWALTLNDWIAGLAMRDYVERHLSGDLRRELRHAERTIDRLRQRGAALLHRGALELSVQARGGVAHLALTVHEGVDARFLAGAARRIEGLLRRGAAHLTLHIEALPGEQREAVERLLRRLARHGDRVSVRLGESLRDVLAVDSSVFHLSLGERP